MRVMIAALQPKIAMEAEALDEWQDLLRGVREAMGEEVGAEGVGSAGEALPSATDPRARLYGADGISSECVGSSAHERIGRMFSKGC